MADGKPLKSLNLAFELSEKHDVGVLRLRTEVRIVFPGIQTHFGGDGAVQHYSQWISRQTRLGRPRPCRSFMPVNWSCIDGRLPGFPDSGTSRYISICSAPICSAGFCLPDRQHEYAFVPTPFTCQELLGVVEKSWLDRRWCRTTNLLSIAQNRPRRRQ